MAIQLDTRPSTLDEAEAAVVAPEPTSEQPAVASQEPEPRPAPSPLPASQPRPRRPLPGGEPALLIEHVTKRFIVGRKKKPVVASAIELNLSVLTHFPRSTPSISVAASFTRLILCSRKTSRTSPRSITAQKASALAEYNTARAAINRPGKSGLLHSQFRKSLRNAVTSLTMASKNRAPLTAVARSGWPTTPDSEIS